MSTKKQKESNQTNHQLNGCVVIEDQIYLPLAAVVYFLNEFKNETGADLGKALYQAGEKVKEQAKSLPQYEKRIEKKSFIRKIFSK